MVMVQSERQLEEALLHQLEGLGFSIAVLPDAAAVHLNLKVQLEKFNETIFSDSEFKKILGYLMKGDRFDKAKILRDRFALIRDNENISYVRFFNIDQWCKNEYQVSHQITQVGSSSVVG